MRERKRNRLIEYDYSRDNLYFVTSCVQDRVCCFGNVVDGKMQLNDYGKIAHQQFEWLGQQYPYVVMHEFVVMPNHVHAIIEINRKNIRQDSPDTMDLTNALDSSDTLVGSGRDLTLPTLATLPSGGNPKIKSLSELMGAYKMTSSKQIHLAGLSEFKWQRSFHDRIIRNDGSYGFIMNYIYRNPENWKENDILPNE